MAQLTGQSVQEQRERTLPSKPAGASVTGWVLRELSALRSVAVSILPLAVIYALPPWLTALVLAPVAWASAIAIIRRPELAGQAIRALTRLMGG